MDVASGAGILVVRSYQQAVWPAVLVAYALAIVPVAAAFRPSRRAALASAGALATLWMWTAIAWFAIRVRPIVPALAWILAAVFAGEAALIVLAALRGTLRPRFDGSARSWLGLALAADATVAYPLTGVLAARPFPAGPMFGVMPWPVVVFTLAILLLAEGRSAKRLAVLPLVYAAAALVSAMRFGPAEDLGMAAAALLAGAVCLLARVRLRRPRAEQRQRAAG